MTTAAASIAVSLKRIADALEAQRWRPAVEEAVTHVRQFVYRCNSRRQIFELN
jgi:hypothetical protein